LPDGHSKKKSKIDSGHIDEVREDLIRDIAVYDLKEWSKACKSFAPIHYDKMTRKQYVKSNESRVSVGREIADFINTWEQNLRKREEWQQYKVASIRNLLVDCVRTAQREQGLDFGLLNTVKLSGFKTLMKWVDNPSELEKGPYWGAKKLTQKLKDEREKRREKSPPNKLPRK